MTRVLRTLSTGLLTATLFVACSDSGLGPAQSTAGNTGGAGTSCTPGLTQGCLGPGVCQGVQVCRDDGSGWGACECGVVANGGAPGNGGQSGGTVGGSNPAGGDSAAGGSAANAGGSGPTGGAASETGGATFESGGTTMAGGSSSTGGTTGETGGSHATGGVGVGTGGTSPAGGSSSTGGSTVHTGGSPAAGGTASRGGSSTGGSSSTQYIQIDHGYSTDTALGIAGPWFTVAASGTIISPSCDAGATCYDDVVGTKVCASGTSVQVPCTGSTCDYANYWGGGIWFHFNQAADPDSALGTWDGSSHSGVAFHFDNPYGTTVRVYLKVAGDSTLNYCLDVTATGDYVVGWQQFRQDCWSGSGTSVPTSYRSVINGLSWQFSPSTLESIEFQFCVSNLRIY